MLVNDIIVIFIVPMNEMGERERNNIYREKIKENNNMKREGQVKKKEVLMKLMTYIYDVKPHNVK